MKGETIEELVGKTYRFVGHLQVENGCKILWDLLHMSWVVPLPRMPVTTRIMTFLVWDPYKPSFATVIGRGGNPTHVIQIPFVHCNGACQCVFLVGL